MVIRCPSSSSIKLDAIREALQATHPDELFDIQGLPVELQDRSDMTVNAQPEGRDETVKYARLRLREMQRQHGPATGLDIGIESGAIDGFDVTAVVLDSALGEVAMALSQGIMFPEDSLEEAQRRGFKTTTAGDIIHERHPDIPSNNWQEHFPPYISRREQIRDAVIDALRQSPEYPVPAQ